MKHYPSIPHGTPETFNEFNNEVFTFLKVDGSNLRWEWNPKRGWYKYGTRTRLFDHTDPQFGGAIDLFQQTLAGPIEKVAQERQWPSVVAFTEYWGPDSFAGSHSSSDRKQLTLLDISPHRWGMLGPRDFLAWFPTFACDTFIGVRQWTPAFIQQVREGAFIHDSQARLSGLEGVVGKAGAGHTLLMAKLKTQAWIDRVHAKHGDLAAAIIAS